MGVFITFTSNLCEFVNTLLFYKRPVSCVVKVIKSGTTTNLHVKFGGKGKNRYGQSFVFKFFETLFVS